ncbi:NAD(P)H-dependent glycerol-3-phosphate dehydrogenase [Cereibacter johrii]|uniref:NAD(P)H-dependent glycerol-3-phosphate dehydrogenase n=1 Tax=Cereibacter johrii TaxID=445629 RepID=UPI000DCD7092|nr:NAD(P)H-dependent glycerol-3-phosphate dehydrogenase [Cereibacter johrii]RAZ82727.1 glycerol-3-phosphate dehydrogenase [Cereibacter johrii]
MIGILGAGAFGTALAVTLGREQPVTLWARGGAPRLAVDLPEQVRLTADLGEALAETVLLAVPMQALGGLLRAEAARLRGRALVACCKGVDLATGLGPTGLIAEACPGSPAAILTGPSFAADIARGLPTALTLATQDEAAGEALQRQLSTAALRLYRTTDTVGAELGGALKNVIAIAAGVVIGAGLGQSARAALMTRGYAEMQRLALALGARPETLAGLSGLGDLVLTCTSDQSRNFRYGQALGAGAAFDGSVTVEGRATARAVVGLAVRHGIDMPITAMVDALVEGRVTLPQAIQSLLSRPLKQE